MHIDRNCKIQLLCCISHLCKLHYIYVLKSIFIKKKNLCRFENILKANLHKNIESYSLNLSVFYILSALMYNNTNVLLVYQESMIA